ncbi:MAG: cytochrome C [Gammaproteobacteria bacterium]|nr:cytochrome C [Gammaproteobacteria bacterium]
MMNLEKTQERNVDEIIPEQGGIPNIVKVISFMIAMVLVFTGIANLLPQVEGEAPKDIKVDLGALTMDSYIALGETLFKGKGTCTLCHNNMGRAPDIPVMDMEATAVERLNDPDYKGVAKDSETYFRESMVDPSAYIVSGYGKPGEPSTMPAIDKAPIALSEIEMGAIIAYLQAKDGGQPSVELPTDAPAVEPKPAVVAVAPAKAAGSAEDVLAKYACTACHAVLDSPSTIGPELKLLGARSSREEIRQSIINPSAVIAPGYPPIMPGDFADKMLVKELEMVVDFLAASKDENVIEQEQQLTEDAVTDQLHAEPLDTEQKGE